MNVNEFITAVKNHKVDEGVFEDLLNDACNLNGADIEIMETIDFEESYASGNILDLEDFAKIVRYSELNLDAYYVRTDINNNANYREGNTILSLLDDTDLEAIYDAWIDNQKNDLTSITPEDLYI